MINKKISYIQKLENEIKILEDGNLDYNITINENDELSFLAESINEMRKSFIDRLQSENEARIANSELITAISHDLRTPLTALVGYLDIIEYKKYKTTENLMQYIHNSREKAYQIKSLSDKLFEEEIFMLSNEGFIFDYIPCNDAAYIDLNLISIRRVFDNIFSNISKYADRSSLIKIRCYIENNKLYITVENKININLKSITSTGIGLKTCNKIIQMHNGNLLTEKTNNSFKIIITLDIKAI